MSEEGPVPEEISCSDQVFDIAFHPACDFLATALIDGGIEVWKYGVEENDNKLILKNNQHTSSCRGIRFNERGDVLYSISSDRTFRGMDGNGNEIFNFTHAHENPLNRLCCITENTLVTGDDAGEVKLWDLRMGTQETAAVMQWHLHEDFVSGFAYNPDASTLVSVSGDSTLCMYDFRNKKISCRSDEQESEMHCVQILKGGRKVVAGTQDGVMLLFSWDRWGDCSDRYPGHPEPVDCMWKIDESTVITGSSDGLLRVVSLHPNKILGVIGDHEEFPVEGMCASRDGRVLGSFAHDEVVRFWDISMFTEDDGDEFDAEVENEITPSGEKADSGSGAKAGAKSSKAVKKAAKVAAQAQGVGADGDAASDGDSEGDWEDVDSSAEEDGENEDEEGEGMELEGSDEEDEEEGEEGSAAMEESGDSDASGSDSDDSEQLGKGPKKLPTASEKFFADL